MTKKIKEEKNVTGYRELLNIIVDSAVDSASSSFVYPLKTKLRNEKYA